MAKNDRDEGSLGSWKTRRRFLWVINGFCIYCVAYIMHKGTDNETARIIVEGAFFTMITTLGSYVFGAAWQDINFCKIREGGKEEQ